MFLSLANSATCHGSIPPRLCARVIRADMRALRASLSALESLGGMVARAEGSGCPEPSPAVDRLPLRPSLVVWRRAFAAVCWHLGVQKRRALAPLRWAGAGKAVEQCSQVRVVLVAVDTMVPCEQERPHTA
jgi:hypothetical protein